MSYTESPVLIDGRKVVAADWNTYLRDNIAELYKYQALGDLVIGASSNTTSRLPIGSTGQTLSVVNGAPAWTGAIGCRVANSGSQSIPNDTETDLTSFPTESYDTHAFHAGSNGYLTIPANYGGLYMITATGYFAADDIDNRLREIGIKINTTVFARGSFLNGQSVDPTHCSSTLLMQLNAGDTVKVTVKQKSGDALNFNYSILSIAFIGKM